MHQIQKEGNTEQHQQEENQIEYGLHGVFGWECVCNFSDDRASAVAASEKLFALK
jgi:hypothetical protein